MPRIYGIEYDEETEYLFKPKGLIHEQILIVLEDGSLAYKQIEDKFQEYSKILKNVIDREIKEGKIIKYKKDDKDYYKITDNGIDSIKWRPGHKFIRLGKKE